MQAPKPPTPTRIFVTVANKKILQRQKLKITTNHKNLEQKLLQTLKKKLKQELQAVLLLVIFIYVRENPILSFARVVQRGDCETLKIFNDFILVLSLNC